MEDKRTIEEIFESLRAGQEEVESSKFSIDDEDTAIWAANKISDAHLMSDLRSKSLKDQKEKEKEYFEKRMAKYDEEIEKIEKDRLNGVDFLSGLLMKYFFNKKKKDKKYMFRHPFVTLKLSAKTKVYEYDEKKMGEYLLENHPDKVETINKFNKTEVKKLFKIDGNGDVCDQETGESSDWVRITEKEQIPQIKISK